MGERTRYEGSLPFSLYQVAKPVDVLLHRVDVSLDRLSQLVQRTDNVLRDLFREFLMGETDPFVRCLDLVQELCPAFLTCTSQRSDHLICGSSRGGVRSGRGRVRGEEDGSFLDRSRDLLGQLLE